jgi:hypothetical protein
MGENQAKGNEEGDKIPKMGMDRPYIEARKPSIGTRKEEEEREEPGLHGKAQ